MSDEDTTSTDDTSEDTTATDTSTSETVTMTKAEADGLRRELAESRKAAKRADAAAKAAAEEKAKKDGEWQTLAEQREQEKTELETRLANVQREGRVKKIADKLEFKDADDILHRLTPEEQDDDRLTEAALKKLAKDKPYLLRDAPRRTGASVSTAEDPGGKDDEDWRSGMGSQIREYLKSGA